MPAAVDRFLDRAAGLGIEVTPRAFPEGTRTAADAAAAVGCDVAQIVKSLVFVTPDGDPVLALTSGANRVDPAALAAAVAAPSVRKATADEVRDATGFAIGGTPPFGHPRPIRTLIDPELLRHDEVWAAAGTPTDVFPVAPRRLVEVTGAEAAPFTEGSRPAR